MIHKDCDRLMAHKPHGIVICHLAHKYWLQLDCTDCNNYEVEAAFEIAQQYKAEELGYTDFNGVFK